MTGHFLRLEKKMCVFLFFVVSTELNADYQAQKIVTFLVTQLTQESDKDNTSPKVLALLSTGIAKLLLCGTITDEKASLNLSWSFSLLKLSKAVKSLLMVYFSPYNLDNQELKQCLTFFTHVYSHSSVQNQRVMGEVGPFSQLDVYRLLTCV
jgi:condensin complex subunit 3